MSRAEARDLRYNLLMSLKKVLATMAEILRLMYQDPPAA